MTEYQELQVIDTLGTENWVYVGNEGENDDGWKVYQTDRNELFAVCPDGRKVSFEVYTQEDGSFERY